MDKIDTIAANIQILAASAPAGGCATSEILWKAYELTCNQRRFSNRNSSTKTGNFYQTTYEDTVKFYKSHPLTRQVYARLANFMDVEEMPKSCSGFLTSNIAPDILQAVRRLGYVFGQYVDKESSSFNTAVNHCSKEHPLIYGVRERFDQNYGLVRDIIIANSEHEDSAKQRGDTSLIDYYIIPLPTTGPDILHR